MIAEQVRQDQIANDLANASTPGYKAARAAQRSFGELLVKNSATGQEVGRLTIGTEVAEIRTDLTQGPIRQTDEPLDVALQGNGFLSVRTPEGVRYTRNGQLRLDGEGNVVTQSGHAVLDDRGQPLKVARAEGLQIGKDGALTLDGKAAGRLGIVTLSDAQVTGDTLFTGTPGERPAETTVQQGALEGADVNPARAMVDMMLSLRAFEASQRVIHTIDETLGRGISAGGSGG